MTLGSNALSQAKTILNSSDVISWSKVEEHWGDNDKPSVRVKMKIYSGMLLDAPGDLVSLIRRVRSAVPRGYSVEFQMRTVV